MVNATVFGSNEQVFSDINVNQTVYDLLKDLLLEGPNFVIVYYGHLLKKEQVISELAGLRPNDNLYIIHQKTKTIEPPVLLPAKAKEVAKECLHRIEQLQPFEEEKLLAYIYDKNYKASLTKEYRSLINQNWSILNAMNDYSCIIASLKEDNFVERNPNFSVIVKSMLDKFIISTASTSWFGNQNNLMNAFPPTTAPQQQIITTDMLQNALANVFGSSSANQPISNSNNTMFNQPQSSQNASNPSVKWRKELQTLHEFGFMDDSENLVALEACEGNIDQALEFIISMRE